MGVKYSSACQYDTHKPTHTHQDTPVQTHKHIFPLAFSMLWPLCGFAEAENNGNTKRNNGNMKLHPEYVCLCLSLALAPSLSLSLSPPFHTRAVLSMQVHTQTWAGKHARAPIQSFYDRRWKE